MNDLKRIVTTLQSAQPHDKLQNLVVFPQGATLAVFSAGTVSFESFQQVGCLCDYIERRPQPQENLGGDGI